MAEYDSYNKNEFKIIIRSLIVGLIIWEFSDIILGIDVRIINLLNDFIFNASNRRKIDSEFYMELMFIEKLIADYKMEFIENREDREILQKFKEKAKKLLDDKVSTRKIYKIELIEEES